MSIEVFDERYFKCLCAQLYTTNTIYDQLKAIVIIILVMIITTIFYYYYCCIYILFIIMSIMTLILS